MTLSEFAVTIPGWLTVTLAASNVLLSIQLLRWYAEASDPLPPPTFELPFLAEEEENGEDED